MEASGVQCPESVVALQPVSQEGDYLALLTCGEGDYLAPQLQAGGKHQFGRDTSESRQS